MKKNVNNSEDKLLFKKTANPWLQFSTACGSAITIEALPDFIP